MKNHHQNQDSEYVSPPEVSLCLSVVLSAPLCILHHLQPNTNLLSVTIC